MKSFKEFFLEKTSISTPKEVHQEAFTFYDFRVLLKNIISKTSDKDTLKVLTKIMSAAEKLESVKVTGKTMKHYSSNSKKLNK